MGAKAFRLWILVFFGVICLAAGLAEGQLIAYWPLDETSGTIAQEVVWRDDPTINLDGHFEGMPVWDPDGGLHIGGVQSGAIYLHGGSDRIIVPQADDLYDPILDFDREPMSLAFWMKTDGVGWPVDYAFMVSKGYSYRIYANGPRHDCRWRTNYGGIMNCGVNVSDGEWHHLCGTYDGEFDLRFYVDGILRAQKTNSQPRATYNTGYNFSIGASDSDYSWGSERSMKGWIDEVSVWGMALSEEQIRELAGWIVIKPPIGVNIPPVVDAGPPQISHLPEDWWLGAEVRLNGAVEDQTVFGANVLSWFWEEATDHGSLAFYAADGVTPDNTDLNGVVTATAAHIYEVVLTASDGIVEVNDVFLMDVRLWGWTGELIKYSFENNLLDTGADSTIADDLWAERYRGFSVDTDRPVEVIVSNLIPYEPGIVGQAVRLDEIVLDEPEVEWIYNQPEFTGTLLQTNDSLETHMLGYGTFTIEGYVKPDPGFNVLGRFIYLTDDVWRGPHTCEIQESTLMYYTVIDCDPEPYQFGGYFYQEDGTVIKLRYGAEAGYTELLTPPGQWHHVAFTGDGQKITVWVNGFGVWSKPYDGTLNVSHFSDMATTEEGMRISSYYDNRNFEGLIDEIKINVLPSDQAYMKSRVLLIPLRLLSPVDGLEYAGLDTVLRWDRIKGPIVNPQYEVYLGEDAGDLPLVTTTTDLFYEPTLGYDTTYYWYVKPVPEGRESEIRSFTTAPVGFDP
ncbi:MAG: LamG domain-containing protein, partial [Planctomycetes bacterium]|nr:LamG domain-containing protein [Planctomycetota bacterium]